MPICKKCNYDENIKSGKVNDKQRYQCKQCGCHFTEGDNRTNEKIIAKKALCVMFYSLGKASFRMLAKIFDTLSSLVYRWVVEVSEKLPEQQIDDFMTEIEFDEEIIRQLIEKIVLISKDKIIIKFKSGIEAEQVIENRK